MREKKFLWYAINLMVGFFLFSCATTGQKEKKPAVIYRVVECPAEVREAAIFYAGKYVERETEFVWGGRDLLEKEDILELDCSGFIVCSYKYAVKDTEYSLLFNDAPLSAFYEYFTVPVDMDTLKAGDIIFMGTEIDLPPTHMSIFVRMDNENIYFMDATLKEEDGINGATLRHYSKDDPKFLSFARLLVRF